jgi:LAO/AO transport system kinase
MNSAADILVANLIAGQPRALARAISIVENERDGCADILKGIAPHLGKGIAVGFTGPPGAGKSTLINAFVQELRRRQKRVGILAVDPSSPITGGAILGDRIRMSSHAGDPEVFTRSIASRGHLGGLSRMAGRITDVMDAAGKEFIIVETVGAGQSQVEIASLAEIKVVICAPGLGDEVQAIKAGILEIADILVVNKADMPLAETTRNDLAMMLSLRKPEAPEIPLLLTVATTGTGIKELVDAVETKIAARRQAGLARDSAGGLRRLLADTAAALIQARVADDSDALVAELCGKIARGEVSVTDAARRLLNGKDI